jgi:RNA polymerase sigma-70 factor (ECF subfamily)
MPATEGDVGPYPTDKDLAEGLMAGSPDAFEPFVERFAPLIQAFGRRMCGHRDDGDEVLQDTLLKAYKSVHRLRDPAALRTWVFRVAANACLRMRRRDKHEPRRMLRLDDLVPRGSDDGAPPEIPDWSGLPLDRLLEKERTSLVETAILSLPRDYRIVLLLRDQEGFDTRETARILGISETLAKVRLHRARLALRRELEARLT